MNESQSSNVFLKLLITSNSPRQLRTLWKLLLQTVLMFLIGILVNISITGFFQHISSAKMFANEIMLFISITGSVLFSRKFFDKKPINTLGITLRKSAIHDIVAGIGISFFMMAFIFTGLRVFNQISIESYAWESNSWISIIINLLLAIIMFMLVAWNEELLSRGYHLQTITNGTNRFWGIMLSSSIFSVLHLLNPNHENKIIAVIGIFLAGVLLSYAYLSSDQLWLPIGIHFGWNFFQGVLFGFPVSGMKVYNLIKIQITGASVITGGTFGPESGLIILPAIFLGGVLIKRYTHKHRKKSTNNLHQIESLN